MLPREQSPGRLLCLLGLCVAFAGIGAGHLSRYFIFFDVFSHLTLHFAIAAIALGWAYFLPRHRLFTAIGLMLLGMLAIGLWASSGERQLGARSAQVPEGYRELRVMWLNSWLWNQHQDGLSAEIEYQDPDIVMLAEISHRTLIAMRSLRERYPYQYPEKFPQGFRLYMMSRVPLQDVKIQGVWKGPVFLHARLGPSWGNLSVVGTHTIRAPAVNAQWKQINALASYLQGVRQPMVVMGDFNATPYSRMVQRFSSMTGLVRRTYLPTWPAQAIGLPQLAIDHMWAHSSVKTPDGVLVGNYAGSDHLPFVARLLVPVQEQSASLGPVRATK